MTEPTTTPAPFKGFVFERGQAVELYADLYPASIQPMPEGVPVGTRIRILVHQFGVTIGWSIRAEGRPVVNMLELPMTAEELSAASFTGGEVGALLDPEGTKRTYTIGHAAACSSCGSQTIKAWTPYPGVIWTGVPRQANAEDDYRRRRTTWSYGGIPRRAR